MISDLHGNLIDIEPCDILFICGDIVPLRMQRNIPQSEKWFKQEFGPWLASQPCKAAYVVAGNHDFLLEAIHNIPVRTYEFISSASQGKGHYLHEDVTYEYIDEESGNTYKIWGAPYCHQFGNWAFMPSPEYQAERFAKMPENCDFVICHDPATFNDLGLVPPSIWSSVSINAGNEELTKELLKKKPKYYFCGHIHEGNHELTDYEGIKCANVSILNDRYDITYEPLYLDI